MRKTQILALFLAALLALSLIGCGEKAPSAGGNTAQGEQNTPEGSSESPVTSESPVVPEGPKEPDRVIESEEPEEPVESEEPEETEKPVASEAPAAESKEPTSTAPQQEVNISAFEPVQISPSDLAAMTVLSVADYSNMDRLAYDCTAADAEERAIDFILIPYHNLYYTYYGETPAPSYKGPNGEYLDEQTPDPLGQIPVSMDTVNCYVTAPGEKIDYLLRNMFNVEPKHPENSVLVNCLDFWPMQYYWYEGNYYCENPYGIGSNLVMPANTLENARRSGDYLYGRLHSEADEDAYRMVFDESYDLPEPEDLWVLLRQNTVDGEPVWSLCYMGMAPLQNISRFVYAEAETVPGRQGARAIYEDFFAQGGWDIVMDAIELNQYLDLDQNDAEVQAVLADLDQDGMDEMILMLQFPLSQESCLLDIDENGKVQVAQTAFNGGGSGGGYAVEIRYDTQEQRNVAVLIGNSRLGIFYGTEFLYAFGEDLTDASLELVRTHYYLNDAQVYQEEMDQIRQETDLWVETDGYLLAHTKNGTYISQDEFDGLWARFVIPEDPALHLRQTSPDHPVPQD